MNHIESLSVVEKIYLMEIYFSVSLWEYLSFQKKADIIKYNVEYGYYSLIQWLAIGIGLVSIFGWKTGFLVLSFCFLETQRQLKI